MALPVGTHEWMSIRDWKCKTWHWQTSKTRGMTVQDRVQLNSLTVATYSTLKLTSLTTIIITAPCCAFKISAAAADNFGWLGGTPSVLRRRQMIPVGGGGAIRWLRGLPLTVHNVTVVIVFRCISELNSKLQDTLEMIDESMDVALSKTCGNFDDSYYSRIQTAYRLLGKTQVSLANCTSFVSLLRGALERENSWTKVCQSVYHRLR